MRNGAPFPARATTITTLLVAMVLNACSDPPGSSDPPPSPPVESNLYMITGDDPTLYAVDPATGRAGKVGAGLGSTVGWEFVGLAPGRTAEQLYANDGFDLVSLGADGASLTRIGGMFVSEGLAYDPELDVLYGSMNGNVYSRSPNTGEVIEMWIRPPTALDVEGLAFDPETRTLFGLIRGWPEQPQFNDIWFALYALQVDEELKEWSVVGSTGRLWKNAGLAFDLDERVLYAIGAVDDPSVLFRIDPETADTTLVGQTGIDTQGGGLAWQKD